MIMMDIDSTKGRFGWETFGEGLSALPYIVRIVNGKRQKFVSVRVAEKQLLNKYLNFFTKKFLMCKSVPGYLITQAEAELLNDLNNNHAEQRYGEMPFVSGKECVVRIEDLKEFCMFIFVCYNKLNRISTPGLVDRCGFIMMNSESVVPYTCIEDAKRYVPLFFFEGAMENLRHQVVRIDDWNLAYLKFCCMVQGIRPEEYANDWCSAISLENAKKYISPSQKVEDFWPSDKKDSVKTLIRQTDAAVNESGSWVHVQKPTPSIPRSIVVTPTLIPSSPLKSPPLPVVPAPPVILLPPEVPRLIINSFENGYTTNQTKTNDSIEPGNKTKTKQRPSIKKTVDPVEPVHDSKTETKQRSSAKKTDDSIKPVKECKTKTRERSSVKISDNSMKQVKECKTETRHCPSVKKTDDSIERVQDGKTEKRQSPSIKKSDDSIETVQDGKTETRQRPSVKKADDSIKTVQDSKTETRQRSSVKKSDDLIEPVQDAKTETKQRQSVKRKYVEKTTLNPEEEEPAVKKRLSIKTKSNEKKTRKLDEEEPAMKKRLSTKEKKETNKTEEPEEKAHSSTSSYVGKVPSELFTPNETNKFGVVTVNEKCESVLIQTAESMVTESPLDITSASGSNLLESNHSVFQLKPMNAAAPSKASNPTNAIVTEPCNMVPHIDRTNFNDIKIKAGKKISFDINVTGEPVPKTKWLKNYKDIHVGDRMKQTHVDYNTKISIRLAKREDSGFYILTAKNINGKDIASVEVTILDRPRAPEGPLKISDVYAKGCKLSWKKPKDDGGQQIEKYVVEMYDKALGSWLLADKTDGSVTNLYIKNLIPGHNYKFRVKAENKQGKSAPLTSGHTINAENSFEPPSRPSDPEIKDYEIDFVELVWNKPKTDGGSPITGYIIEMRDQLSSKWVEAAETSSNSGIVSGLIEENQYEFRVLAVNKAGPGAASEPTLPHVARDKKLTTLNDYNMLPNVKALAENLLKINKTEFKELPETKECCLKGDLLMTTDSIYLTNEESLKKLKVINLKRSDDGLYHFVAKDNDGINIAMEIEKPSKPKTPNIIDYDNQSVTLKWEASENNGSSPIIKYIIEKKYRLNPEWELALEVSAIELKSQKPELNAQILELKEKSELQFRITAVNQAGPSPTSDPTNIHIVKHKSLKPLIDRTNLKNIVVRVGETVKYDVNIKGEPAPIVTWKLVDKEIKSEGNVQIVNVPYNTIITLSDTERKDSGLYKIIAENEFGKDEATIEVTVLDHPTIPHGPLKITNVTCNGAKVEWGKPKDEGGKPVTAYVVEKMEAQTGRWIQVGQTQELEMNIEGLQEAHEYSFRVKALNVEGESKALESDEGITTKNSSKIHCKSETPKITDLTCTKPKEEPITENDIQKKENLSTVCDEKSTTEMDTIHLRQLFVSGLNTNTTDEDLKNYFEQWGKIIDTIVVKDLQTKLSRRFGFITYAAAHMVDNAQRARPHRIDGKLLELKRVIPKTDIGNPEMDATVKKLFVRWYDDSITEEHLREHFSVYGNVISAFLVLDKDTGVKRGFGFVEFDDYDPVDKICLMGLHKINEKRIYVKKAISNEKMVKLNTTKHSNSTDIRVCDKIKPEAKVKVDKLFVHFRGGRFTEEDLEEYFSAFGNVFSVIIPVNKHTGGKQPFGFVEFDDYAPVDEICLKKSHKIKGIYIHVEKFRKDGIDPDQRDSGPSFQECNRRGPSTNVRDDNFGNGYQQNFDSGPIRRYIRSLLQGAGDERPYSSSFNRSRYNDYNNESRGRNSTSSEGRNFSERRQDILRRERH